MKKLKPYIKVLISDFIREELEVRKWSKKDFVKVSGIELGKLDILMNGEGRLSDDDANKLSKVFGQSAECWLKFSKISE